MRALDLAAALVIGISSIALLGAMDPAGPASSAARSDREGALFRALAKDTETLSIPAIQNAPPDVLCAIFSALSNRTVVVTGVVDGHYCGSAPTAGSAIAAVAFPFQNSTLVMVAWSSGPA